MTPRTHHRHLVQEGTSYRTLLEDVHHRLAVDHLTSGRGSIKEIAYMLGYSDDANVRRALWEWLLGLSWLLLGSPGLSWCVPRCCARLPCMNCTR
ncbi:MAG: hypothetical protein AAFX99_14730 [Myxococcota bacterium]